MQTCQAGAVQQHRLGQLLDTCFVGCGLRAFVPVSTAFCLCTNQSVPSELIGLSLKRRAADSGYTSYQDPSNLWSALSRTCMTY